MNLSQNFRSWRLNQEGQKTRRSRGRPRRLPWRGGEENPPNPGGIPRLRAGHGGRWATLVILKLQRAGLGAAGRAEGEKLLGAWLDVADEDGGAFLLPEDFGDGGARGA